MNKQIEYIGPSRLTDYEITLFQEMMTILNYSDPGFTIKVCRKPDEIIAHIQPSAPVFKQTIIDNLLHFNRIKKVRIRFSSSLAISKMISFTIDLYESILSPTLAKNTNI